MAKGEKKEDNKAKFDKDDTHHKKRTYTFLLYIAGDLAPLSVVDSHYHLQYDEKG